MNRFAILGASGAIGKAVARRLVAQGDSVVLLGRNEEKLSELSHELFQPMAVVDFSNSQALEDVLKQSPAVGDIPEGKIHGIVNCIGSVLLKPAHGTSDDEFRTVVETNLFTAFATIKAGAKLMRESGGSIILFASAAAQIGIQNHEAIAASKAGIIGLAKSAAATYAPYNIRVNVISPGLVKSEMTRRIWDTPASAAASMDLHALGRFGEPDEIASLGQWLLNPDNSWITGQVIAVDGGLSSLLPKRRN